MGEWCLQDVVLEGVEPDEETLQLIFESIRDGADDSDEDEMQQVGPSQPPTMQMSGMWTV